MTSRGIILIGAGGHAKVLLEILRLHGRTVKGVTTLETARHGTLFCGVPVLGGDELLRDFSPEQIELVNAIGNVGRPAPRIKAFENGKALGFTFATLVHPSAIIAAGVELGEGAQIMAGAILQPGASIGMNAIINTRASIDHDSRIGPHSHIAPGATLCGEVVVGNASLVGAGATVLQGIRIGTECIVAAGALLRANLTNGMVVSGVPALPLRRDHA